MMYQIKGKIIRFVDYLAFGEDDYDYLLSQYSNVYDDYISIFDYMQNNYDNLPDNDKELFDNANKTFGRITVLYDLNYFYEEGNISLQDLPLILINNVDNKNMNPNTMNNLIMTSFELLYIVYRDDFFDIETSFIQPFIDYIDKYDPDIIYEAHKYGNEDNNVFGVIFNISFITTLKVK